MSGLFGRSTEIYGHIVNDIAHDLIKERYTFEDISQFKQKSLDGHAGWEYSGRVYWTEMLYRAHMSSVASIFRTTRWIQVAIREHDAGSLYGCASACRSLIESAGDVGHSLNPVALTLARIKDAVKAEISGKPGETMIISEDLENSLIHFTHARKVGKTETAPDSHKAMQAFQYINMVEKMKIPGVKEFYAELCEIVHPAAESVRVTFSPEGDAWIADPLQERAMLDAMIAERKQTLQGIVLASYNAPLLILRVLHAFNIFTKLSGLRKYQFDGIPQWKEIEALLRS